MRAQRRHPPLDVGGRWCRRGGRGPSGRIEEHGFHVWLGFYENAFALLRQCYAERNRDGRARRFADWREAFIPSPHIGLADRNADGLVLRGTDLTVVRNFSRMVATLRLSADGSSAVLLSQEATDATRVLTTAKFLRDRILFVDSKFDEAGATPPYEVVTDPFVS